MTEFFQGRLRITVEVDVLIREADAVKVAAEGVYHVQDDAGIKRVATSEDIRPDIERQNRLLHAIMGNAETRLDWITSTAYLEIDEAVSELGSYETGAKQERRIQRIVESLNEIDREYFKKAEDEGWFAESTRDLEEGSIAELVDMVLEVLPEGSIGK
ncbi:MAG: hypothetical protein WCD37_02360 [Chloroflexia bacterium]